MVPPVLMKTALVRQPILRLVWSAAFESLRTADEVIFIGYSLPVTDLAARYLFAEALGDLDTDRILIVNRSADADLLRNYRESLPALDERSLVQVGGKDWIGALPVVEQLELGVTAADIDAGPTVELL
jgi:hypothetical protein